MKGKVSVLLTALLFALLFCVSASAQTINGNIVGTITDEQGAAVPGVTVTATNKATGFSRSNVSNDEGNYRISALPSGDYAVTTDKSGFGAANISVDVNVSADSRTDIVLKAGQVQASVTVSTSNELLDTTTSQVAKGVEQTRILELPGRNLSLIHI